MEKTEVLKYCRDEVKLPFLVPYDLSTVFELPKVEDESKARFKMVEGDRRKIRLKIVQHESGLKGILFIDGFVYEEAVSKKKKIKWINKAIPKGASLIQRNYLITIHSGQGEDGFSNLNDLLDVATEVISARIDEKYIKLVTWPCDRTFHKGEGINFNKAVKELKKFDVRIGKENEVEYLKQSLYGDEYKVLCPLCNRWFEGSPYLCSVFTTPQTLWIANLVTHYRHGHITSWNKCWGWGGGYYRSGWFGNYDDEKAKVNERAKRQLIRGGFEMLRRNGVTPEDFQKLQNTTEETIIVARKYLDPSFEKPKKKTEKKAIVNESE